LFGSTTGTSSIASVADDVARARVDNDSVETDTSTTSVHVNSNGMVTSVCLGPDGMVNSIRHIFSLYTDCQPFLFKNHFCLSMGEDSTARTAASGAYSLGFSPACTGWAVSYAPAPCEECGDGAPVQPYTQLPPVAWAYYAKGVSSRLMKQAKGLDPLYHYIGIGSDLRNWMPDTGASSHFTPCLLDLKEVKENLDLGVEVAGGHIVKCTARGIVEINMIADDGPTFESSSTWSHLCPRIEKTPIFCHCLCQ
jgi:hypothetical protein